MINPKLAVTLRPSRAYPVAQSLLHCTTLAVLLAAPLPWVLRSLFLGLLVLLVLRYWQFWRKVRAVQRLRFDGEKWIIGQGADEFEAKLGAPVYLSVWLMVLPLKLARETLFLPVLWDSGDADDLRRLRVLLNRRESSEA